jgi:hypothetical protein
VDVGASPLGVRLRSTPRSDEHKMDCEPDGA